VYPEEGTIMSIDYMAIPKGAQQPDLAHAFIDFMLRPESASQNINYIRALIPVTAAYELLSEEQKRDPLFFPPDAVVEKVEMIEEIGPAVELYYKAWDRLKAG
jgi:spermidine/putrescine-binding protein